MGVKPCLGGALADLRLAQAYLAVRGIQASLEKAQQDLQTYTRTTVPATLTPPTAWQHRTRVR